MQDLKDYLERLQNFEKTLKSLYKDADTENISNDMQDNNKKHDFFIDALIEETDEFIQKIEPINPLHSKLNEISAMLKSTPLKLSELTAKTEDLETAFN